jgi:hypothetical protein
MNKQERALPAVEWTVGVILTIAAIILQVHWSKYAGALWRDEVQAVHFATMSGPSEIWAHLAYNNYPPFLFVLLRPWIAVFGRSDDTLRWFGFAIGLFSLAASWTTASLFRVRAPLLLLAVVGLSPLAVSTIDSVRPYGLGICLMCLMTGCFWYTVSSRRVAAATLAATAAALSVHCLYQNIPFLLAVACAGLAVTIRRRDYRSMWLVALAAGVPLLSLFIHLPHLVTGRDWGLVAESKVSLSHLLSIAVAALSESGPLALVGMLTAMLLLPASAVFLCVRHKPLPDRLMFAATGSLIGFSAYMFFVLQTKLPSQLWYYVIVISFVALCLDAASFHSSVIRWSRVIFAVLVACTVIPSAWIRTQVRQTNVDHIVQTIRGSGSAEDFVIVYPWYHGIAWNYYADDTIRWSTVPPLSDLRIHRYDLLKEQMTRGDQQQIVAPVIERIRDTLMAGKRVWVVGGMPTPPRGKEAPILPPAPLAEAKWSGRMYEAVWGMQVTRFLQAHAVRLERVPVQPDQPVSRYENLSLAVLSGWRD